MREVMRSALQSSRSRAKSRAATVLASSDAKAAATGTVPVMSGPSATNCSNSRRNIWKYRLSKNSIAQLDYPANPLETLSIDGVRAPISFKIIPLMYKELYFGSAQ